MESKVPTGQENFNFLDGLDDNETFDKFTTDLLNQFVNKDLIYEPILEAKKKVQALIDKDPKNKTKANLDKLAKIDEIVLLLDKKDQTQEDKDKIIKKFEELNDSGGLPEEIMKDCIKDNPELANLQSLGKGKGCDIF